MVTNDNNSAEKERERISGLAGGVTVYKMQSNPIKIESNSIGV